MLKQVFIGFDPREVDAFAVAAESARNHIGWNGSIDGIVLSDVRKQNLYNRPTSVRDGCLWDHISEAPMSTEFAISRFLVPFLADSRFAMFADADVLFRSDLAEVFDIAACDRSKAVWCVKHNFAPAEGLKMDNQIQTRYARKNWSSVMIFNVDHPSNERLTLDMINSVPGRELHRFCWLDDDEIGELPPEWNYLVGHTKLPDGVEPKIVHFTDGIPSMKGYKNSEFADEWREILNEWAAQC